ncbi:hypothetical protein LCGC14_2124660 [marine sediment metagenome]|uniref:Uncharacterized protein n=1 Tax=marine sediment metagenome TaxID=412755 RepID=A0A0F9E360_9ZZZZ
MKMTITNRGQIKKFWIVTDPSPFSELADICFETTVEGLFYQFKGGLTVKQDDAAMFLSEMDAQHEALYRLEARDLASSWKPFFQMDA